MGDTGTDKQMDSLRQCVLPFKAPVPISNMPEI